MHDLVLIAWHRFGPYHHARLRAAASTLPVLGLEMSTVDPINSWAPIEQADGFTKLTAYPNEDVDSVTTARLHADVAKLLDRLHPVAVAVHGWGSRSALVLLSAATARRLPIIMMSASTAADAPRRWHTEALKRQIIRGCAAALVGGTPQVEYMVALGMDRDRIFPGYDTVDNAHFAHGAAEARAREAVLRRRLGLPPKYFLASARFVEKKNLLRLLEAYATYRNGVGDAAWDLVLLGDGALRQDMAAARVRLALERCVILPGFKQYDELPTWYGLASGFVHASLVEQWGLVVNEAMASGLPVLVSNRCGCATDLVRDGKNGFTFDPYDIESIAARMHQLSHGDRSPDALGRVSRGIIAEWGPERFASGLAAAVSEAICQRPARGSYLGRILLLALLHAQGTA